MCELYADRSFNVSDYSDNDSDVPTSSHKQQRSSGVTSDAETSAIEEESSDQKIQMK